MVTASDGKTFAHPAVVPGFKPACDLIHERDRLALHLAQKVWAPSGIPKLEIKAMTTASALMNQSPYPDIQQAARKFLGL